LRTTWLWEKIRAQGGAYGAYVSFSLQSGTFNYLSYRDPNLLQTLDNYDLTGQFLRHLDLSEDELSKSIIGTIGQLDAYQLPDAKGYSALNRHLTGMTEKKRQQLRDEVLGTTAADFKAFADVLDMVKAKGQVVVLGSSDAIKNANAQRNIQLKVTKIL
jgi:Zn-dependent M16 (insulinase) family peptidase